MADLGPPPGWDTPGRSIESYTPVNGPVNDGDYIQVLPSGGSSAVNDDIVGGTVATSVVIALDNYGAREQQTHQQGSTLGEVIALPEGPDSESSHLLPPPPNDD